MAFDKAPSTWLGEGYDLTSSVIGLETATTGRVDIGTCTVVAATDVFTVSTDHGLRIGNKVQFTTVTTLPDGLSLLTDYYVLTIPTATTLTVSDELSGTVIDITDTGTGDHTINRPAALAELTDTEANATTGNISKLLFAICEKCAVSWYSTVTADRPSNMTISRSSSTNETTGDITKQYVLRFVTEAAAGSFEVKDET